jgi:hypothetical protein
MGRMDKIQIRCRLPTYGAIQEKLEISRGAVCRALQGGPKTLLNLTQKVELYQMPNE